MRKEKIMKYSDYLRHLRHDDCPRYKMFGCPEKCDVDQDGAGTRTKYSYEELEQHLKYSCPNMLVKCFNCNFKEVRSKFPAKHSAKNCIKLLQEKQEEIRK